MKDIVIKTLSESEKDQLGITRWPVWEKEKSRFDWEYDSEEECLILEGEVRVETPEGVYTIKEGDFVTFRKGLKCTWDISRDIRKHYRFR